METRDRVVPNLLEGEDGVVRTEKLKMVLETA